VCVASGRECHAMSTAHTHAHARSTTRGYRSK
jgi:hypothetical protein